MEWDYKTVWRELETGRLDGTSSVYEQVLRDGSVARIEKDGGDGFWGVFSYDDVTRVAVDPTTFSSHTAVRGARVLPLQADPPEHAALRRVLNPYFKPERVRVLENELRPVAGAMLDEVIKRGSADFTKEIAMPFPIHLLCRLMRVPDEDWEFHQQWATDVDRQNPSGLLRSNEEPVPMTLLGEFIPYMMRLVADRRANPGDDVISGIINAETDGKRFDDQDVIGLFMSLMLGGHHTTSAALSTFILRLSTDTKLQNFLRQNPERIPDAVEESLRIDSPQQAMARRCIKDTVLGGQEIKAGEYVILQFGSANVDPEYWDSPADFDIDRKTKGHVAFGRGIHQCVGASLARMDMRVVTEELLGRTKAFHVSGAIRRSAWPRLMVVEMPLKFVRDAM